MTGADYIPSFGRPAPPPREPERADPETGLGRIRVALVPVLDPEAAAQVEEQLRLMVAQAIREGLHQAIAEVAAGGLEGVEL